MTVQPRAITDLSMMFIESAIVCPRATLNTGAWEQYLSIRHAVQRGARGLR